MLNIEVGKPFEAFKGRDYTGQTGAVFEAMHGGMYMCMIFLPNMTETEVTALRKTDAKIAMIAKDDLLFPMFRFGSSKMIFEILFDPTKYKNDERVGQLSQSNLVNIVGIDSNTNIVKMIRSANIPLKTFGVFIDYWSKALQSPDYSLRLNSWYDSYLAKYDLEELWNMGIYVGKLGE